MRPAISDDSSDSAPVVGEWKRVGRREREAGGRRFHYLWQFDDGRSGFVIHHKNRRRFSKYVDSNDNQRLDRSDALVVRGRFKKEFRNQRPGRLLGKNETGIITAKPFVEADQAGEKGHHGHGNSDFSAVGINSLGIEHLSFLDADKNMVLHDHGEAHNHLSHDHSMM